MATTEIHKMIPTIISRCQRFDFRKLTLEEIVKRLDIVSKKEKAKIERPALELIALNSGGAIRDAEGLLDQVLTFAGITNNVGIKVDDIRDLLGLTDVSMIGQFIDYVSQKNRQEAIDFLGKTFERGYDPQEFTKSLIRYLRQAMLLKINPTTASIIGLTKEEKDKMLSQIEILSSLEIQRALNLFMDAENRMKYSSITELPLELATVDFLIETA